MHQRLEKQRLRGMIVLFAFVIAAVLIFFDERPVPVAAAEDESARPASITYIVQAGTADEAARLVEVSGGEVVENLPIINAVGALLTTGQVDWLRAQDGRIKVYEDATLEVSGTALDTDYPALVGAAALHDQGITGKDVTIAVLDTGLWRTPALEFNAEGEPRILAERDATESFTWGFIEFADEWADEWDDDDEDDEDGWSPDNPGLDDWNGHGTHVTSVIASSARTSDGRYQGVAPGANIVAVRAFKPDGSGTYGPDWRCQR